MKSLRLSRVTSSLPLAAVVLFGTVACAPGAVLTSRDGAVADDGGAVEDAGLTCSSTSCASLGAPTLAKICPDGTTLGATVCEDQGGHCGWSFPACPPGADASEAIDVSCPTYACDLPDCLYGVIAQTDTNGCPACGICALPPDAGKDADTCQCGAPPPTPVCPGGGVPSLSCEAMSSGSCSWIVGSCPTFGNSCKTDADCGGDVCAFPESGGCDVVGRCVSPPQAVCNAFSPGCACDGTLVNVACTGLPAGYVSKPLQHTGVCADGG